MTRIPLSEIDWGPTDANEQDDDFLSKFVEPAPIEQLFTPKYWLISGGKGSGKSALRQALLQKYKSRYCAILDLSFDSLEFTSINKELSHLAQVTNLAGLTLLTNYWRFCLIIEAMRAFAISEHASEFVEIKKLKSYFIRQELGAGGVLRTMLNTISKAWTFIDVRTAPSENLNTVSFLPSNLTAKVIDSINRYPNEQASFVRIQSVFADLLRRSGKPMLIILDGFDRIKNTSAIRDGVNLIFESLASAVYSLAIDRQFSHLLEMKTLIPNDRYLSMNLRDIDKLDSKHKSIRWNHESLKGFLAKRMALHPRLRLHSHFEPLWFAILPEKVPNLYKGIEENSYDYILRHTMYRPRHLQIHLEKLASLYPKKLITREMVPKAIRESCKKLAEFFFKEYAIDHPNLAELLGTRFKGKDNVMPFKAFREIIARGLKQFRVTDITPDQKVDILYTIGLFGVIEEVEEVHAAVHGEDRYFPPRKANVSPYKVDFYHTAPRVKIAHSLSDDSLVALHPIFVDFAEMKPHPHMIIG